MASHAQLVLGAAMLSPSFDILGVNDLARNSSSALFVRGRRTAREGIQTCRGLGEELIGSVDGGLVDALRWHGHKLDENETAWISSDGQDCRVWSFKQSRALSAACDQLHPVLCSNTAPVMPAHSEQRIPDRLKVVTQSNGIAYQGFRERRTVQYLGVPFAAPPIGSLRFQPPQPYSGPSHVNATARRAYCMQPISGDERGDIAQIDMSEDCLYLNIWTPTFGSQRHGLPVLAVYHGGAFSTRSPSQYSYSGAELASRGDIIVVNIAYRLGALGQLATQNLIDGNQATQDQIAGLEWIKENIAAFGGDATRVTIYGRSAGGQSVVTLLASPPAHGFFRAAISQSAPLGLPFLDRKLYAEHHTPHVADALGCDVISGEKIMVDCLMKADAAAFVSPAAIHNLTEAGRNHTAPLYHIAPDVASIEPLVPIVDGKIIAGQPAELMRSGRMPNPVPLILGMVRDEAGFYLYRLPGFDQPIPPTEAFYQYALARVVGLDMAKTLGESKEARECSLSMIDADSTLSTPVSLMRSAR